VLLHVACEADEGAGVRPSAGWHVAEGPERRDKDHSRRIGDDQLVALCGRHCVGSQRCIKEWFGTPRALFPSWSYILAAEGSFEARVGPSPAVAVTSCPRVTAGRAQPNRVPCIQVLHGLHHVLRERRMPDLRRVRKSILCQVPMLGRSLELGRGRMVRPSRPLQAGRAGAMTIALGPGQGRLRGLFVICPTLPWHQTSEVGRLSSPGTFRSFLSLPPHSTTDPAQRNTSRERVKAPLNCPQARRVDVFPSPLGKLSSDMYHLALMPLTLFIAGIDRADA
jgi:hypothetical protein